MARRKHNFEKIIADKVKFNNLLVIESLGVRKRDAYVRVLCDCGNVKEMAFSNIVNGTTKSCGCWLKSRQSEENSEKWQKLVNENKKYGLITLIEFLGYQSGKPFVLGKCDCGNEKEFMLHYLRHGDTKSCGCLPTGITIHGHSIGNKPSPELTAHNNMKERCYNVNLKHYNSYGGRGIRVCDGWLNKESGFINFFKDLGLRPSKKHSVDRINNDGNYSCGKCEECLENGWPMNLRWATQYEQSRNRRNNHRVVFNNKSYVLRDLCNEYGKYPSNVVKRLRSGESIEDIFG